jgi:hypothetical protein
MWWKKKLKWRTHRISDGYSASVAATLSAKNISCNHLIIDIPGQGSVMANGLLQGTHAAFLRGVLTCSVGSIPTAHMMQVLIKCC